MPLGTSITAGSGQPLGFNTDNAPKVIHRFGYHTPKPAIWEQSQPMNQFRRVRIYSGFALALAMALSWQQASGAKAESSWQAPLDAPLSLINPYRQPNSDFSAGHRGVDYAVRLGQPIYAPTDAKIHFSGFVVNRWLLSLKTESGDLLEFEPACSALSVGTSVSVGEQIATACTAGQTYRGHCEQIRCLHFSLRTERGYLSPLVRYGALAPSVLLPTD